MTEDTPVLRVDGLRKTFRSRVRDSESVIAVDSVSLAVAPGESLAIVGESGSGKTTIARILVGLERADAGTVEVAGADVTAPARSRRARLRRARAIQMVFQNPYGSLDPAATIEQSVAYALALHGVPDRRVRTAELLDRVGLGKREREARPASLSGGQLQRAAIARCLCVEPDVLVLDEAVAALDVSIQAQILLLIDELRTELGLTCVFISHDLAVVEAVSDRVAVLLRGKVVEEGDTASVLRDPRHEYTQMLLDSVPRPGWVPTGGRADPADTFATRP
ncbi:ABC transporter ATP-binding protein [Solicola gregarius]|uniref:ATP-binding cassette domain-containing protein n=1 Tax=Solicola gregarius TaxID=2908642 RepID=A0AA46YKP0_9ACTN|nr:ATP-binding cassette domain-containing protein [Solicola gregarius]UYM05970.1 ATP-binding cassette domain-containing protein [Solicola gregarius]